MARKFVVALLGLALVVAFAISAESVIQTALVRFFPAAGQPIEVASTPIVSGTGTADTVRVYRGAVAAITDDHTTLLASGLDTTKVYLVRLGSKIGNQANEVRYAVNFSISTPTMDNSLCPHCSYYYGDPSGTSGTDSKLTMAYYVTGTTGSIEMENRLGVAVPIHQLVWEISAGAP